MQTIQAYGAYLPHYRLDAASIRATLGTGSDRGTRTVAGFDEDSTSMAVEASRAALKALAGPPPELLLFATSTPAYLDKTNATAVHAALGLDDACGAFDIAGSPRSALGGLRLACSGTTPALVVSADVRTGKPGSADEAGGGDAAAAIMFGEGEPLAQVLAAASSTAEFLDRWRTPGDSTSRQWEDRFSERVYLPRGRSAVAQAVAEAGLGLHDVDQLVVVGSNPRAVRVMSQKLGSATGCVPIDVAGAFGECGAAQAALGLVAALARAQDGDIVLLVSLCDGADALVVKACSANQGSPSATSVREALAAPGAHVDYARFLTWRGMLDRELPRRPEPASPAGPVSARNEAWKFGFNAATCDQCGTRHLPPERVCLRCSAQDQMQPERMTQVEGVIRTFTVDHLAFSPSPPTVLAVVDFDGGGRYQFEMADVDPASVAIGDRVEMSFRRLYTAANGIHNYFWKARPSRRTA